MEVNGFSLYVKRLECLLFSHWISLEVVMGTGEIFNIVHEEVHETLYSDLSSATCHILSTRTFWRCFVRFSCTLDLYGVGENLYVKRKFHESCYHSE